MFETIDSLENDLIRFSDGGFVVPLPFRLVSSDVGKALIQLAGGKTPAALVHLAASDGRARPDVQKIALRFVADILLSPVSNHFTTLGVVPDFEATALRGNFRRLMALVHPDARPVGFPEDAASRVNRAYAVLADEQTRETYTFLEIGRVSVGALASVPAPQRNETRARSAAETPTRNRLQGWAAALRARQSLLWLAALLLVPLGMGVMSLFSRNEPQRLVEARPRLPQSSDVQNLASNIDSRGAATTNDAALTTPTAPERPVTVESTSAVANRVANKLFAVERAAVPPVAAAFANQPSPTMTSQLSAKSIEVSSRQSVNQSASLAPSVSVATVDSQARAAAPTENVATPRAQDGPMQSQVQSPLQATASPPATVAVATASPPLVARSATTADRNDSGPRVKSIDADEVVVRFSNAYESGSISAFSQLLAPGMSGRRQMLSDYERVFQGTRQRSIKFKQLKHSANGERISTTGYATVTTVDQENRTIVQRVFLEFDIGRDRGESRIERLANYVIN